MLDISGEAGKPLRAFVDGVEVTMPWGDVWHWGCCEIDTGGFEEKMKLSEQLQGFMDEQVSPYVVKQFEPLIELARFNENHTEGLQRRHDNLLQDMRDHYVCKVTPDEVGNSTLSGKIATLRREVSHARHNKDAVITRLSVLENVALRKERVNTGLVHDLEVESKRLARLQKKYDADTKRDFYKSSLRLQQNDFDKMYEELQAACDARLDKFKWLPVTPEAVAEFEPGTYGFIDNNRNNMYGVIMIDEGSQDGALVFDGYCISEYGGVAPVTCLVSELTLYYKSFRKMHRWIDPAAEVVETAPRVKIGEIKINGGSISQEFNESDAEDELKTEEYMAQLGASLGKRCREAIDELSDPKHDPRYPATTPLILGGIRNGNKVYYTEDGEPTIAIVQRVHALKNSEALRRDVFRDLKMTLHEYASHHALKIKEMREQIDTGICETRLAVIAVFYKPKD